MSRLRSLERMATPPNAYTGRMEETRPHSAWRVLALRPFRAVWIADFVSNLGFFAQGVGAGWLMTSLTTNAAIVSLVQTASSLPLFLFAIPAGVLADVVDRRRLIRVTNVMLAALVGILAFLTAEHVVTPAVLLSATFVIALVDAIQEPAWGALIPEIVPDRDLPDAIALNGIEFNLSRVVGPPVAGLVVGIAGPAAAFTLNALSFVPTVVVMRPQARPIWPKPAALRDGIKATFAIVRTSAPVRDVLLRNAAFGVCASVIFALLPLYARVGLHGATRTQFGFLFAMLGLGSVTVAQFPRALARALRYRQHGVAGHHRAGDLSNDLRARAIAADRLFRLVCGGFSWLTVLSVSKPRSSLRCRPNIAQPVSRSTSSRHRASWRWARCRGAPLPRDSAAPRPLRAPVFCLSL